MRMIVFDQATDLQGLRVRLFGNKGAGNKGAGDTGGLDRLRALNPHVDLENIRPGTVVLVPDAVSEAHDRSESVPGTSFAAFAEQARDGLKAAVQRVADGHASRLAEQKTLAAVLKSAAVLEAMHVDEDLKGQAAEAAQTFKQDQQAAKVADKSLAAFAKQVDQELSRVSELLDKK